MRRYCRICKTFYVGYSSQGHSSCPGELADLSKTRMDQLTFNGVKTQFPRGTRKLSHTWITHSDFQLDKNLCDFWCTACKSVFIDGSAPSFDILECWVWLKSRTDFELIGGLFFTNCLSTGGSLKCTSDFLRHIHEGKNFAMPQAPGLLFCTDFQVQMAAWLKKELTLRNFFPGGLFTDFDRFSNGTTGYGFEPTNLDSVVEKCVALLNQTTSSKIHVDTTETRQGNFFHTDAVGVLFKRVFFFIVPASKFEETRSCLVDILHGSLGKAGKSTTRTSSRQWLEALRSTKPTPNFQGVNSCRSLSTVEMKKVGFNCAHACYPGMIYVLPRKTWHSTKNSDDVGDSIAWDTMLNLNVTIDQKSK